MHLTLRSTAAAALLTLTAFGPKAAPVRVLFLLGGEHHQYEANMKSLEAALRASGLELTADFVRIDTPPAGKPQAEKATIASNPDVLKGLAPGVKYDVVVAYTQDSYLDKITADHVDGLVHFVRSGGGFVGIHCAADTF